MVILNNLADTMLNWHSNNGKMTSRKSLLKKSKQTNFGVAKTSKQPLFLRRSRSSENVNKSLGGRVKTESVLVRILRKSHGNASRLEKPVLRKKLTVLQCSFMIPNSFKQWKLRLAWISSDYFEVVITPSVKLRVNKITGRRNHNGGSWKTYRLSAMILHSQFNLALQFRRQGQFCCLR